MQRTACIHTAKLPYCQTASRTQSLASVTQCVAGKGQSSPELCHGCPTTCRMKKGPTSSAALAYPAQLQKYLQGGKEEGEGSTATSLSRTISLCQLMLFMEFQLSPDNSTVCQIDRPPPGLHWENMQQCQPTKRDTPALNTEQEQNFFVLHLYFAITSAASQWCGL